MSYRGGLRQCATFALTRLGTNGEPEVSILRSKTGKYYTVLFPPDYKRYHDKVQSGDLTLVLCMTPREIQNLLTHPQASFLADLEIPQTTNDKP